MENFKTDFLLIFVVLILLLGFGFLVYLPKCCQKYSQKSRKYKIEEKVTEIDIIDSWCSESISSGASTRDSTPEDSHEQTVTTDNYEEMDELLDEIFDHRTVDEIIKITINCPGGKAKRKAGKVNRISHPGSKVVRNLNREMAASQVHRQIFAV